MSELQQFIASLFVAADAWFAQPEVAAFWEWTKQPIVWIPTVAAVFVLAVIIKEHERIWLIITGQYAPEAADEE